MENGNGRLASTSCVVIRQKDGGYFAKGPGFYIWDEDPEAVLETIRELEMRHLKARRGRLGARGGDPEPNGCEAGLD